MDSEDRWTRSQGERKAINSPIQGTGADIIKYAMTVLDKKFMENKWYPDIARMLINVHDEIVFEIKLENLEEVIPVCRECMVSFYKVVNWEIPLEVEPLIGLSWAAPHDWDKMKAGKEDVPEWLQPYFKVETQKVEIKEESKDENKNNKNIMSELPSKKTEDVYVYKMTCPLNEKNLITLRNICLWAEEPIVAAASTQLIVEEAGTDNILVDENRNIKVDPYHFKILAKHYGL